MSSNTKKIIPFKFDNNRENSRRFTIALPGYFIDEDSKSPIFCQITNVSNTGAGVTSQDPLKNGKKITLITLDAVFNFEVIWCNKIENSKSAFCYTVGLKATDVKVNLYDYFCNLHSNQAS